MRLDSARNISTKPNLLESTTKLFFRLTKNNTESRPNYELKKQTLKVPEKQTFANYESRLPTNELR
mgnify:CR=1 FL=1